MVDYPLLITGCARSGTSTVTGILHHHGLFGGKVAGPAPHNKKGIFENGKIKSQINKPLLRNLRCDPMGQYPLPETSQISNKSIKEQFLNILYSQGYNDENPVYFKGVKSCLLWPIWHHSFPNAQWIIVRRSDQSIAQSCNKQGFMKTFKDVDGWKWWVDKHKEKFQEMKDAGLNITEVWFEDLINGDYKELKDIIESYGIEWSSKIASDFIELKYVNF